MSRIFRVYAPELIESKGITECSIENCTKIYGGNPEDPYIQYIEIKAEGIGDEYHSMHELYQHRMALNIAFFNYYYVVDSSIRGAEETSKLHPLIMKSKLHFDGTMFEGYFIVMAITTEGQISYHYKLKHWDKFKIPEVERTPEYDGHNSEQVIERLMKL